MKIVIKCDGKFFGGISVPAGIDGFFDFIWVTSPNAVWLPEHSAIIVADELREEGLKPELIPAIAYPKAATLFREYGDMADGIASRLSQKFSYVSDLEDQAQSYLATLIMEDWDSYDPARAGRNTWVFRSIVWHLQKLATSTRARRETSIDDLDLGTPESSTLDWIVEDVSADAHAIVELLREDPEGVALLFRLPQHHRPFQEHLISLGWSWDRVFSAWAELGDVFCEPIN